MENTRKPIVISKNTFLYGIIVVLILIIFGKGIFASDNSKTEDSLLNINGAISDLSMYKVDLASRLKAEVDRTNDLIKEECGKIPESTKSAVDCSKFIQDYKIKILNATGGIAPVPSGQGTVKEKTLREFLNISECETRELNFNTKHKLPKYGLEWLAYDIPPCEKGISMKVFVPLYGENWKVEKVSYGANMGNYVILKQEGSDLRVVYAHTVVDSKLEGKVVSQGTEIGVTNVSGESTGMHLHVEIWKGTDIVSKHIFWSDEFIKQDQKKLMNHRKWDFTDSSDKKYWEAYNKAIIILHKEEGLSKMGDDGLVHAYPDYKGCSIGFGSRANSCDEAITVAEANKRLAYVVRDLVDRVQKNFPKLNSDSQASITSFAYNCHEGYKSIVAEGLQQHQVWCKKAGGVRLEPLVSRRANEWNYISNDPAYKYYVK